MGFLIKSICIWCIVIMPKNNESAIATTDYELPYASALQKNNFYGVQFHPEKSGRSGERILQNFLKL